MTAASPNIAGNPGARGDRFGHPRALTYLFATEMWERFSYYGMRALLVLYMVKYLLQPAAAGSVLGLASFRAALETVFGPLDLQPLASQIYGFYTGFVYLTPILGGLLADRVFGRRRTVILGAEIDADIEDREGAVAATVAGRIERADLSRDVRLEGAVAENEKAERDQK